MSVNVVSTTDSKEDVTKAMGMYSKAKPAVETTKETSAPVEKLEPKAQSTTGETKEASDTSKVEAESVETTDEAETTPEAQAASQTEANAKKGGFQRRIDKLTKARTQAEQEAAYWRDLALKAQQKPDAQAVAAQEKTSATTMMAGDKPDPDKFNTVQEYMEAVADWKIEQREAKKELAKKVEEAKATQAKAATTFQERAKEFKQVAHDFDDVVAEFNETHPNIVPNVLNDALLESEFGPQLIYDLAKDPNEIKRLAQLTPTAMYKELGKREARYATQAPGEKTPQTNKTTKAPPPIDPVKGSSGSGSSRDPDKMSYREYFEWRKAGGGR